MYTGAVTTFSIAFRNVLDSLIEIQTYDIYYDKPDEYLNLPKTLRAGKELIDADRNHIIEFGNVSFKYSGSDVYALKNINITIPFGQKLSIVGENGAGKTIFVKLMTRMYDSLTRALYKDAPTVLLDEPNFQCSLSFIVNDFESRLK